MENMSERLKELEARAERLSAEADAVRREFWRLAREEGWSTEEIEVRLVSRPKRGPEGRAAIEIEKVRKRWAKMQRKSLDSSSK